MYTMRLISVHPPTPALLCSNMKNHSGFFLGYTSFLDDAKELVCIVTTCQEVANQIKQIEVSNSSQLKRS